jgi:SAM-dependent methyltransferase
MYLFDNAAPEAPSRLAALSNVFDPGTIRHLLARGVGEGWTCLEIGGGSGSITRWLSERVGPGGFVLTTDIDPRYLERLGLPNVEVHRHDIVCEALPEGTFDLAYARLVLEHVSEPDVALTRMAASLKPGGWLVVEDLELPHGTVGDIAARPDFQLKTAAAMRHVTMAAGVDGSLAPTLARRLRRNRLARVGTEGRVLLWQGGTDGAALMRLNFEQLRAPILASGLVTAEQFEADLAALDDEDLEIRFPTMWTAWGQRIG